MSESKADHSQTIARSIERGAGEQVTCTRVGENNYRCNWWRLQSTGSYDNPGMRGMLVTTSRICRSQFLHATLEGERLSLADVSPHGKITYVLAVPRLNRDASPNLGGRSGAGATPGAGKGQGWNGGDAGDTRGDDDAPSEKIH